MRNKRYRGDYQVQVDEKKRKHLEYTGQYHELNASDIEIRNYSKVNSLAAFLLLGFHLVMAFLNTDGTRIYYIVFPYLFSLLCVGFMISGVLRVIFAKNRKLLEMYDYEKGYARIYHSISGCMILAGITAFLDIIYLIGNISKIKVLLESIFLVLALVSAVLSYFVMKYDKKMDRKITIREDKKSTEETEE